MLTVAFLEVGYDFSPKYGIGEKLGIKYCKVTQYEVILVIITTWRWSVPQLFRFNTKMLRVGGRRFLIRSGCFSILICDD